MYIYYMRKRYSCQRLYDYALWYYFRYYPSNARLLQKLTEKGSEEDTQKVFQSISHLLQEEQIIASKVDNYIFRNKNYRYIRQKMWEKLFESEKVESYLEEYTTSGKSLLTEDFLRRKIEILISKGKSQRYISTKLWETPEDREKLGPLLNEYFKDWEWENIKKEYEKIIFRNPKLLQSWYEKKQKIIQKLIAKWFHYREIKNLIPKNKEY